MKPFTPPRAILCALLAGASLLGHSAWAQTPEPAASARAGTFKQVQGAVSLAGQSDRPAPGDALRDGDRLQTGRQSTVTVVLQDGTLLAVGPNSEMDLSQFQFNTTTQDGSALVNLLRGSVRVITGLMTKTQPERFQVRTPTAVVGVRGTDFIVEANPPVEHLHVTLRQHWKDHSRLQR